MTDLGTIIYRGTALHGMCQYLSIRNGGSLPICHQTVDDGQDIEIRDGAYVTVSVPNKAID